MIILRASFAFARKVKSLKNPIKTLVNQTKVEDDDNHEQEIEIKSPHEKKK